MRKKYSPQDGWFCGAIEDDSIFAAAPPGYARFYEARGFALVQ
jgi:hypothetical protein